MIVIGLLIIGMMLAAVVVLLRRRKPRYPVSAPVQANALPPPPSDGMDPEGPDSVR